ncbi:hypothetical protein O181_069352 [Austropuccinia psidii MF-1]|uniref:Uncharacterized protein n=1 Tax=Austropuccinia psidii MF-1 TaxID=1389203 RepID=A0A9Q3F446_9BASI|nr:hypothetical protein [Austropuccinia psidii MF-1]
MPFETQSQANTPVTPSEPEGSKSKEKRHSEGLITAEKWMPIATQRNRKPQNSALIQGKPTLTTVAGKITIINPVKTLKAKYPKSADKKCLQGTVKETWASKGTNQRTEKACPEQEDLEEDTLDTMVDGETLREIIPTLPFSLQFNRNLKPEDWKDMNQSKLPEDLSQRDKVQRAYGNHQRLESHQAVQTPLGEGKQDKGESSHYPSYRRTADPDRAYSDSFRLTRSRPNHISSGFKPFRNQQISGQESPFFTIPGSYQEKTRIQGQKQDHLQAEEERVRL